MGYSKTVPHGVMFHHFHDAKHPRGQGSISREDFDKILNLLGVERFLSPDTWLEKLQKGELAEKNLCLTFDDGLLCQKEIALPVLEKYGLKAFWFVYSSVFEGRLENLEIYRAFRNLYFKNIDQFYDLFFKEAGVALDSYQEEMKIMMRQFPFYSAKDVQFRFLRDKILGRERYEAIMDGLLDQQGCSKSALARHLWMSNEDLRSLSREGHHVGLHSYSHPTRLEGLSYKEQLEEYQKNYHHLKTVCGQSPAAMSHPCNSYNEDTLTILKELGIGLGFRSNMFPQKERDPLNKNGLEMAREDHTNILREIFHG